ncbi:MAG: hypothetical protein ACP5MU_04080 [Thermoplasmata archaeon]
MKALLTRREKSHEVRNKLISSNIEFYEETKSFYTLFIFPAVYPESLNGKIVDLISEDEIDSFPLEGQTFKIEGNREVIDTFAPRIIKRNLKVKLENPDITLEIHKWGNKYIINVS